MAENVVHCDDEFVHSIKTLLWGNTVKKDVFKRWAQGNFMFLNVFFFRNKGFNNRGWVIYIKLIIIIITKK